MNMQIATTVGSTIQQKLPIFPSFLARPISLLPETLHSTTIIKTLNLLLDEPLKEGDLDFLEGQSVSIEVSDLKLHFGLSLEQEKLVGRTWQENDSLNLKGTFYDFLLLASRKEDSDTLFFQRRLKMTGSTDLGLEVKNLLDGLEMESVRFHKPIELALKHSVSIYERLFSR